MSKINFESRTFFHRDNLEIMRGMNSGTIDLIATDPPFNKGKDFHATPASLYKGAAFQDRWSWQRDVHDEWVDKLQDDCPKVWHAINAARKSYGDDMGAFLCFMGVRLLEMHRLLKNTGSIYLHCDPTASHYLKQLMDAVFGRKMFRNEILWHHPKIGIAKRRFTSNTDTLLFYTKTDDYFFQPQRSDEPNELHRRWGKRVRNNRLYYREAKNIKDSPARSKIKQREKALGRELRDDDVVVDFNLEENRKTVDNVLKIPFLRGNSKEKYDFPTQKPVKLYELIIAASSREGELVLDPFCGCATTLVAAENLNRQWVGIDFWDGALELIEGRLVEDCLLDAVVCESEPPERTDDGMEAAPVFKTPEKQYKEEPGEYMSRAQMKERLLEEEGCVCQGCDREFDDPRYLQLDHNAPRSTGGMNHISNRILLCGPCNNLKSDTLTIKGLRKENEKRGYMAR